MDKDKVLCLLCRCVIAELFMDGRSLFDLSQLLEYRSGEFSPDIVLKRISDKYIRVCLGEGAVGKCMLSMCNARASPTPFSFANARSNNPIKKN